MKTPPPSCTVLPTLAFVIASFSPRVALSQTSDTTDPTATGPVAIYSIVDRIEWRLHSDIHSDPLPLRYFGQDRWVEHLQARPGRNLVRMDQSVELVLFSDRHQQSISLLTRQFARLVASEETVRRFANVSSKNFDNQDWHLMPDMSVQGFSGTGLKWQQVFAIQSDTKLHLGLQGLTLNSLYARDLQGELSYQANTQSYAFDASSTEITNRLKYPFQKSYEPTGQALLFNAHMKWRSETWGLEVGVRDVGWLRWQQLPQQFLQLNSNVNERDSNGYLLFKPLLQGQNSQSTVLWHAPWTADIQVNWSFTPTRQMSLPWQYIPQFGWLPALRYSDQSNPFQWAVEWRHHDRNLVMEAQWKHWSIGWGLNNFNAERHSQVWRLNYLQTF